MNAHTAQKERIGNLVARGASWHWRCGWCGAIRFFFERKGAQWAAQRHNDRCRRVVVRKQTNAART